MDLDVVKYLFHEMAEHIASCDIFWGNFQRIKVYDDPYSFKKFVECPCGKKWSISTLELAHGNNSNLDLQYLIEQTDILPNLIEGVKKKNAQDAIRKAIKEEELKRQEEEMIERIIKDTMFKNSIDYLEI